MSESSSYPLQPLEYSFPQEVESSSLTPEEVMSNSSALLDRLRKFVPTMQDSPLPTTTSGTDSNRFIQFDLFPGVLSLNGDGCSDGYSTSSDSDSSSSDSD
ncbi:hypothetical protein P9112_007364 [Eukaryota sp. TZLM1-RC]